MIVHDGGALLFTIVVEQANLDIRKFSPFKIEIMYFISKIPTVAAILISANSIESSACIALQFRTGKNRGLAVLVL